MDTFSARLNSVVSDGVRLLEHIFNSSLLTPSGPGDFLSSAYTSSSDICRCSNFGASLVTVSGSE